LEKIKKYILRFLDKFHQIRGFTAYISVWKLVGKLKLKSAFSMIQKKAKENSHTRNEYEEVLDSFGISSEGDKLIPFCPICKKSEKKCNEIQREVNDSFSHRLGI
jgi:hypothetical protein